MKHRTAVRFAGKIFDFVNVACALLPMSITIIRLGWVIRDHRLTLSSTERIASDANREAGQTSDQVVEARNKQLRSKEVQLWALGGVLFGLCCFWLYQSVSGLVGAYIILL